MVVCVLHCEALQSYGLIFQGVAVIKVWVQAGATRVQTGLRWGNNSHKVTHALHSSEGPESVNQEDKQIAPSFHGLQCLLKGCRKGRLCCG